MFVIENKKAYLVDGEVGYLANFDKTGKIIVDKEETIDIEGKALLTYEELYAKLNIAYKIAEAKRKSALEEVASEEIDKYEAKLAELRLENSDLKKKIKELEKTAEKEDKADKEPKVEDNTEKVEKEPKEDNDKKENK